MTPHEAFAKELAHHHARLVAILSAESAAQDETLTCHILEAIQRNARAQRLFAMEGKSDDD